MSPTSFFNFTFLPEYYTMFLQGIVYTLLLSVCAVLLAIIPAMLLAVLRLSKIKIIKFLSGLYIDIFRSTPLLVQLSLIYFGIFTYIKLPSTQIFGFVNMSMFIPGVLALALNSSAYVAEIFRAGILAVDAGQTEAARSLGLSSAAAMFKVVLPQAVKNVLPALANEVIHMFHAWYDGVDVGGKDRGGNHIYYHRTICCGCTCLFLYQLPCKQGN